MDEIHPRLPEDLKPAQAEATERARRRDELLEDAVDRWLLTSPVSFTIAEAAMGCGLVDPDRTVRLSMRDQRRIGFALTNAGYVKQRIRNEGERVTMWRSDRWLSTVDTVSLTRVKSSADHPS